MSLDDRLLSHELIKWDEGFSFVCGIDEAGRGCMAGPVVAAAVVFTDRKRVPEGLFDSKQLSGKKRMSLREKLLGEPSILTSVAEIDPETIDRVNILEATYLAMRKALEGIGKADYVLVDGNPVPGLGVASKSIVKGDSLSASIAAASILAKTHRDLLMVDYDKRYPGYGFSVHKGYCTKSHREALKRLGPSPIHRLSYKPVHDVLFPPDCEQGVFRF